MKKIFTILIASVVTLGSFAQTTIDVVTGAGYANDAYYSFTSGTVSTSPRTDWDIAFSTYRYSINILANNGTGVELYTYPDGDISVWSSLDTSGMSSWTQMYNSIEDWSDGAFLQNIDTADSYDQGWGRYNMGNHHIVGDSLFVIKTAAGNYKKLWIIDKDPNSGVNTWEFKYADLDGSNEKTDTLYADLYTSKNHIFYSIDSSKVIDREPASDSWELQFTKYYDYNIPYYVTGVLTNSARVTVQEVDGVISATYEDYDEASFNDTISTIGSDWKSFDMGSMSYVLDTNRVFFAKVMDNEGIDSTYWKIYFTGFTGTSEGKYTFVQKEVGTGTSVEGVNDIPMFEVYPNPAQNHINVLYNATDDVTIRIFNMSGKTVYNRKIIAPGFNNVVVDISSLQLGLYAITIETTNAVSQRKFIKQ